MTYCRLCRGSREAVNHWYELVPCSCVTRCAKGSTERSVVTETERTAKEGTIALRVLLAVALVLGGVALYILVAEGLRYAVHR